MYSNAVLCRHCETITLLDSDDEDMPTQPTDLSVKPAAEPAGADVSLPAFTEDGEPAIFMLPDDVFGMFCVMRVSLFAMRIICPQFSLCAVCKILAARLSQRSY